MTLSDAEQADAAGTPHQPTGASALGHLRVLDLSRILAGPWASQVLADLGAEVIKVESLAGDDTRRWGPPFIADASAADADAAYFCASNRNKKSITVNFASAEGASLLQKLVADCDVLIENFKVGGLKKYGLDYNSISQINPAIVYCSITGFGQSGPYAQRAGYDFLLQGMGGLMSITGQPDGSAGAEPIKVGVAVADLFTGMYAATSILAALAHRDRTGQGQHIDCALLDSQVAMLANQASNYLLGDITPGRMGNNHPSIVPYRAFAARDGHIIVACGNTEQFRRLCHALELPELADNPAYADNSLRVQHRDAVDAALAERIAGFACQDLIALLEQASVPCGPINTVQQVFEDPQVKARELEVKTTRSDGSEISTVAFPARLSATPARYRHAPPLLGQDTETVLGELLGLSADELSRLRDNNII